MKILDHQAAHVLFEQVKGMEGQSHDIWRCIYLNLANKRSEFNPDLRAHFFLDNLERLLEDEEGEVFLCNDGDIFILFRGALRPVVHKLATHFKGLMPEPLWKQPDDDLYTIFDLSKYWQLFYSLCHAKFNKEEPTEIDVLLKVTNDPAVLRAAMEIPPIPNT